MASTAPVDALRSLVRQWLAPPSGAVAPEPEAAPEAVADSGGWLVRLVGISGSLATPDGTTQVARPSAVTGGSSLEQDAAASSSEAAASRCRRRFMRTLLSTGVTHQTPSAPAPHTHPWPENLTEHVR